MPYLAEAGRFLGNLDNMHARVELSFPALRPPSFRLERTDDGLMLHYMSDREGLAPMVIGLLRGLGTHFNEEIEVAQVKDRAEHGHDVFHLHTRKIAAGPPDGSSRPSSPPLRGRVVVEATGGA